MSINTAAELKAFQAKYPSALVALAFINDESASTYTKDVLDELKSDYEEDKLQVLYVKESEESTELFDNFAVSSIPSTYFLSGFKIAGLVEGFNAPALASKTEALLSAPVDPKQALNDRLKKIINSHRIMLFMKGSPDTPRCGFSRQIVALLQENKIEFGSFDILTDDDVRQGLKEYSNWPTYPQLYSNGELVGGLDVVKELEAAGELRDALELD